MTWKLKNVPECGTPRGYDYHTRQVSEQPCELCREAKRAVWRERRAKNRDKLNAWRKINRKTGLRVLYESASSKRRQGQFVGDYSHALALELYGPDCHICNTPIDLTAPRRVGQPGWEKALHIDHIIPISKGGADELANVRPAHAYCNQTKAAKC